MLNNVAVDVHPIVAVLTVTFDDVRAVGLKQELAVRVILYLSPPPQSTIDVKDEGATNA
jgi:hypothetical protein